MRTVPTQTSTGSLHSFAEERLTDTTRFLIFDEDNRVLCSSYAVTTPERALPILKGAYGARDDVIRAGIFLQGQRYEVHCHDPPLVYGRTRTGEPEGSEGIALCRVDKGPTEVPAYGVITFMLPNLTARMVPRLQEFCREHVQAPRH